MRLLAYLDGDVPTLGVVDGDRVGRLAPVTDFWADPPGWTAAAGGVSADLVAADLRPAVPVPPSAKVLCVALNYRMHADEGGGQVPERPNIFARWWATLVPDGTPIPVPTDEPGLDWEVELAVIIGSPLTAVAASDARAGIFGYTVFNDVSARTHQRATSQWANGKNADQSGPIGSLLVTADELDPAGLRLGTRVNGEVRQDGTTADMVFDVDQLIEYATRTITLRPGDVIATGTPDGVGIHRKPPILLHPGDEVEVHVEGIGSVRNPVVDAGHRH